MLRFLRIRNFRGFEDHTVPFGPYTLIIGPNNAGKSSLVEALRILSLALQRHRTVAFGPPPPWLSVATAHRGLSPSLRGLQISLPNLNYQYADPPAIIEAKFESDFEVTLYLSSEADTFLTFSDGDHRLSSREQLRRFAMPSLDILPQVGPLSLEEKLLDSDYVKRAAGSRLAPLHFRNQLFHFGGMRARLDTLLEESWPHIQLKELTLDSNILHLMVREADFVAEVGTMGHGLQVWLQVLAFFARSQECGTLVLDEPDVYLHADLQRRLASMLSHLSSQIVIATHSIEMLGQVDPRSIVVVDRRKPKSRFAASLKVVQQAIDRIGAVHNIHLARVWSAKTILLVEGKDLSLLRLFQRLLFPRTLSTLDSLPSWSIGGWGGWSTAVGSAIGFKNAGGEDIRTYCLLDRDYHSDAEVEARSEEARAKGVNLHIWSRKEIENYLLVPTALARAINDEGRRRGMRIGVSASTLSEELEIVVGGLRETVLTNLMSERIKHLRDTDKGISVAKAELESAWSTSEGRIRIVPGKEVLGTLSEWAKAEFGVTLSAHAVARALIASELDNEVVAFVSAVEKRAACS